MQVYLTDSMIKANEVTEAIIVNQCTLWNLTLPTGCLTNHKCCVTIRYTSVETHVSLYIECLVYDCLLN